MVVGRRVGVGILLLWLAARLILRRGHVQHAAWSLSACHASIPCSFEQTAVGKWVEMSRAWLHDARSVLEAVAAAGEGSPEAASLLCAASLEVADVLELSLDLQPELFNALRHLSVASTFEAQLRRLTQQLRDSAKEGVRQVVIEVDLTWTEVGGRAGVREGGRVCRCVAELLWENWQCSMLPKSNQARIPATEGAAAVWPISCPQQRDPQSPTAGGPVNYIIRQLAQTLRPLVGSTHQMELCTTGGDQSSGGWREESMSGA